MRSRVNQYKKKITEWGLDKKNKENEIRAILRKRNQRAAVGKKSIFLIRGRIKEPEEIEHYLKRKPLSFGAEQAQSAHTPPELECFTPIEIPTSPRTPEVFGVAESILIKLQDYVRGSFEAETWISQSRTRNVVSVTSSGKARKSLDDFVNFSNMACDFFDSGLWEEGRMLLATALAGIEEALKAQEPHLLGALFNWMNLMLPRRRPELIVSMLTQISELAATFFSTGHPIEHICRHLISPELTQLVDLVTVASQSFADLFEGILGPTHIDTITIRLFLIKSIPELTQQELSLRNLLRQYVDVHGADDSNALVLQLYIADNLLLQEMFAEAESMGRDCVTRAIQLTSTTDLTWHHLESLRVMAIAQSGLGQIDLAEGNLRQVVKLCVSLHGWSGSAPIHMMVRLEEFLARMGKHASAAEVRRLRQEVIHSVGVAVESGLPEARVEERNHQAWSALILPDSAPFTLGTSVLPDDILLDDIPLSFI